MPVESPPGQRQRDSEEESQSPRTAAAGILAHLVDAEDLVVDQPLDDVEDPPSCDEKPSVKRKSGRPCCQEQQEPHSQHDQHLSTDVGEAVRERLAPGQPPCPPDDR